MSKQGRTAFTMIELLVVVSIIAVLAAMLMPVITLVRDSALRNNCTSNMRQVFMANDAYRSELEGLYPQVYWDDFSWSTWSTWTFQTTQGRWQHALQQYTESFAVFNCPKVARAYPNMAVLEVAKGGAPRGSAPANGVGSWSTCAMAYNSQCYGRAGSWTWNVASSGPAVILAGKMTDARVQQYITAKVPTGTINRCPVFFDGSWQNDGTNQSTDGAGTFWPHRKYANMVFKDGHLEVRAKKQVLTFDALQMAD